MSKYDDDKLFEFFISVESARSWIEFLDLVIFNFHDNAVELLPTYSGTKIVMAHASTTETLPVDMSAGGEAAHNFGRPGHSFDGVELIEALVTILDGCGDYGPNSIDELRQLYTGIRVIFADTEAQFAFGEKSVYVDYIKNENAQDRRY